MNHLASFEKGAEVKTGWVNGRGNFDRPDILSHSCPKKSEGLGHLRRLSGFDLKLMVLDASSPEKAVAYSSTQ
jgi:hypothetical protein